MKKPQKISLIILLIGIVLVIVSFEIDTPLNRNYSYDPADFTYDNVIPKNGVYFGGILIAIVGAIKFILTLKNK